MAAKLQCEICGGKLIGKPGGIFECDSCGMEYDTAWAKEKIQEITGTVKIEGPVDVQGTVKVDSSANKEALLQRGMMALEEEKWDEAKRFFDQALNFDAKYGKAYLGLVMAEEKCTGMEALKTAYTEANAAIRESTNIGRAKQYGDEELTRWFAQIDVIAARADQVAQEEMDRRKKEEEKASNIAREKLLPFRERCKSLDGLIAIGETHIIGVKTDGTVIIQNYDSGELTDYEKEVVGWKNIVRARIHVPYGVYASYGTSKPKDQIIGIQNDGRVIIQSRWLGKNYLNEAVKDWTNIIDVCLLGHYKYELIIGLRKDGTLKTWFNSNNYKSYPDMERLQNELSGWKDIISIKTAGQHVTGVKKDGTLVAAGYNDSNGEYDPVGALMMTCSASTHVISTAEIGFNCLPLRDDGFAVITKSMFMINCEEGDAYATIWQDIISIAAGDDVCCSHVVGLKSDGTVVAGYSYPTKDVHYCGQCEVNNWRDIVAIEAGPSFTIGIMGNGAVVTTKIQGNLHYSQPETQTWRLFRSIDTLSEERKQVTENKKREEERRQLKNKEIDERIIEINEEIVSLQDEKTRLLDKFFSQRRRKEIDNRIAWNRNEIQRLEESRP